MPRPSHPLIRPSSDRARVRALLVGALLGSLVWALSTSPNAGPYQLAMALIMVVAGSASFVAHSLHERRQTLRQAAGAARVWVCGLGSGACLAIVGIQWIAG